MTCRISEWLRGMTFWGLVFVILVFPLIFTIWTENIVVIKDTGYQLVVFILAALWFIALVEEGKFRFEKSPFNVALVVLLLQCALSAALTPFRYYAVEEIAHFLAGFLSVWLIYNIVRRRLGLEILNWTVVAMISLAIGYGILQKNNIDFIEWGQKVYVSFMGNANFFAAVLVMVIPFVLGMMFSRRDALSALILLIVYLTGCLCMFWTTTRSAWFGFIGAHLMFFGFNLLYGPVGKWLRNPKVLIGILAALVLVTLVFQWYVAPRIQDEINELLGGVSFKGRTNEVRIVMWLGSLKLLAEKPILGHGIGSFQLVFGRYRPSYYHRWGTSHNTRHSHNEPLEILLEQGLVGFVCYMWFYCTLGWMVLQQLKKPLHRYWKQLLIGLLSGIFGSMIDNVASPHLRWTSTLVVFYFLIGMNFLVGKLIAREADPAAPPAPLFPRPPRARPAAWTLNHHPLKYPLYLLLVGLLVYVGYWEWRIVLGDYWLKQGEVALNRAGSVVTPETQAAWDLALANFTKAGTYNPWDHSSLYKVGYVYLQNAQYDTAMQTYQRLISIAPNYAQIHNNIGLLHQNLSQPWEAAREFTWATRLEDNYKNQEHLGQVLMMPPIQDTYRAMRCFGRMPGLAWENWQIDLRRNLFWVAHNSPNAVGFDETVWGVDKNMYSRSWALRGNSWQFAGDTNRARYFFNRALLWNDLDPEALHGLAVEAEKGSAPSAAIAYYARIVNSLTREQVAANQQFQRVMGLTINAIQPKLQANLRNAPLWDLFGYAWFKFGGRNDAEQRQSLEQAYRYCKQAQTINPNLPHVIEHIHEIEAASAAMPPPPPAAPAPAE